MQGQGGLASPHSPNPSLYHRRTPLCEPRFSGLPRFPWKLDKKTMVFAGLARPRCGGLARQSPGEGAELRLQAALALAGQAREGSGEEAIAGE